MGLRVKPAKTALLVVRDRSRDCGSSPQRRHCWWFEIGHGIAGQAGKDGIVGGSRSVMGLRVKPAKTALLVVRDRSWDCGSSPQRRHCWWFEIGHEIAGQARKDGIVGECITTFE